MDDADDADDEIATGCSSVGVIAVVNAKQANLRLSSNGASGV